MVSVCMATYNGSKFVSQQVASILSQLSHNDELLVSDDGSTDDTLSIIKTFNDPRIKIIQGAQKNSPALNFEKVLSHAKGDYIFLSDQDDVWLEGKVKCCLSLLLDNDVVVTDCNIIDDGDNIVAPSFFKIRNSGKGFWKNFLKNSYLGCCMAFRADILHMLTPFPAKLPMHDIWIGFVGEIFYKPVFTSQVLSQYRMHDKSATNTAELKSNLDIINQITSRLYLILLIPGLFLKFLRQKR